MIQCPNCSRENADNFNFCLDCGYDLKAYREALRDTGNTPEMAPAFTPSGPVVRPLPAPPPPPGGLAPPAPIVASPLPSVATSSPPMPGGPSHVATVLSAAALADSAPNPTIGRGAPADVKCPACGAANAAAVKFCGNCGKRIDGGPGGEVPGGHARTMFMHASDMGNVGPERVCKLVTIEQTGKEGMIFTIKAGETLCGRVNGVILFFDDPYVSPTHCLFKFRDGRLRIVDQGSLNGVFLRVRTERKLADQDYLRVGRQLFRFEELSQAAMQVKRNTGDDARIWGSPNPGAFGRIVQVLEDGRTGEIRLLTGDRCNLGREVGDIVIPTDGFISGRHCSFSHLSGEAWVQDLGSSNGTYVRVRNEADVAHADFLLVGNQMLRVEII